MHAGADTVQLCKGCYVLKSCFYLWANERCQSQLVVFQHTIKGFKFSLSVDSDLQMLN